MAAAFEGRGKILIIGVLKFQEFSLRHSSWQDDSVRIILFDRTVERKKYY